MKQYTIEQYFLFCKDFFIKREILIDDYCLVKYIVKNKKIVSYSINYVNSDKGYDINITLTINDKGIVCENNCTNKIMEQYNLAQTELLMNLFFDAI